MPLVKSPSSEIRSLTLRCEIRVSLSRSLSLFEMFRVIENRSNASVAMTSRVLNPPRGTSASFRSSLHSGSRTTRAYMTRRSSALESPGSNSMSRQAAVLHRNWSVPLIHFDRHYAGRRASLYLLRYAQFVYFIILPKCYDINTIFCICSTPLVSRNFVKATNILIYGLCVQSMWVCDGYSSI